MPKAGEIRVTITARQATAAADWIAMTLPALERRPDTILTPGYNKQLAQELRLLAEILKKSAIRKRPTATFTINVPRSAGEAFVLAAPSSPRNWVSSQLIVTFHDRSVMTIARRFKAAIKKHRGRPALLEVERGDRIAGRIKLGNCRNDRYRRRLIQKDRRATVASAAWDKWYAEIRERGETILTSSVPPPKI